jgi:hypothetical protein
MQLHHYKGRVIDGRYLERREDKGAGVARWAMARIKEAEE